MNWENKVEHFFDDENREFATKKEYDNVFASSQKEVQGEEQ